MNVSIIITFYNKGNLLFNAIDSVISQVTKGDEIVLVNDCSSDEKSKKAFLTAVKKYPEITCYTTKKNSGSSFAKDLGINHSKNDIIVMLDADDTIPEGSINKIKQKFLDNPTFSFIYGNYTKNNTNNNQSIIVNCNEVTSNNIADPKKLAKKLLVIGSSPFKKSMYFAVGGYDVLYPEFDDVDLFRKAIVSGYQLGYLNDNIYTWNRSTDGSNSTQTRKTSLFADMRNFEFYYKFLSTKDFFIYITKMYIKLFIYRTLKS